MGLITRAGPQDAYKLSEIAKLSFVESHGHSASTEDIDSYVDRNYSPDSFMQELTAEQNIYYIIQHKNSIAGYSKIIFDTPYPDGETRNITKLERIYLLKEFYGLNLGAELFQFNIDLAKANHQQGIWLYTWKENHRAISFYKKNGFNIIGSHDFKISETHSNPNHLMYLGF